MSAHDGHDEHAAHFTQQVTTPPDHSGHGSHHPTMMGHAMSFHFGTMETILFDFWMPEGAITMFLSCLLVILLCVVMESIRFYRARRHVVHSLASSAVDAADRLKAENFIDAGLHALQLTLAYLLMLIFMTFNVWLCIAIVIGEVGARFAYGVLFPYLETANVAGSACG